MSIRQAVRAHILLNSASGAALGMDAQGLLEQITTAFMKAGWLTKGQAVEPERLDRAFAELSRQQHFDVLIVAGGDGTILTAANAFAGSDIALGIIPLGTFNQFARDLGMPADPQRAARTLTRAEPERIDCARVNGRLFLGTCLIGLPPKVTLGRQRLRGGSLSQRVRGYFELFHRACATARKLTLSIDDGDSARRVRAMSVVVSNNPFSESGMFLKRPSLKSGRLGLYVSEHDTGAGMFMAFLRAFLGSWGQDHEFERLSVESVVIDASRSNLLVSVDGEIAELETPLRFEILPQALCVLRPQNI